VDDVAEGTRFKDEDGGGIDDLRFQISLNRFRYNPTLPPLSS
jgi:hypothetical protein